MSKLNDIQLKFKYKCFFSLFSFLFFFIGGRQKHEDQRCCQRDLHHKSCGLLVSNLGMFSVLCNHDMTSQQNSGRKVVNNLFIHKMVLQLAQYNLNIQPKLI